jgi:hypothetical protein
MRKALVHGVSVYHEHVTGGRGRSAVPSPAGSETMRASLGRRKPTARGVVITAHPASGVRGDQMLPCLIRDHNHLRRDEEVRWFRTPPTLLA